MLRSIKTVEIFPNPGVVLEWKYFKTDFRKVRDVKQFIFMFDSEKTYHNFHKTKCTMSKTQQHLYVSAILTFQSSVKNATWTWSPWYIHYHLAEQSSFPKVPNTIYFVIDIGAGIEIL